MYCVFVCVSVSIDPLKAFQGVGKSSWPSADCNVGRGAVLL